MSYDFRDSFALYAAIADAAAGWWDFSANWILNTSTIRFAGGRSMQFSVTSSNCLTKLSQPTPSNDAVHHINCAYRTDTGLSGTNTFVGFSLRDTSTAQCTIDFRGDGAIELRSGGIGGTVLATFTGAITSTGVWHSFEFEVVINNTTGSFAVRVDGATSNSFSATGLNTRGGTTNNYANSAAIVTGTGPNSQQYLTDFIWRSDASSVAWIGDQRSYILVPNADVSKQFAPSPNPSTISNSQSATTGITASTARYASFTPSFSGTIASIALTLATGYTGNMKCALFANSGGTPGSLIQAATAAISNPVTGTNTFSFSPAVAVTKGTTYWVGFCSDTTAGTWSIASGSTGATATGPVYASWPGTPTSITSGQTPVVFSLPITPTVNAEFVSEVPQDSAATYVFDNVVGHNDLYSLTHLPSAPAPASISGIVTRSLVAKSDAGTRTSVVQIKSGATTVQSSLVGLITSFVWNCRTDVVDPNTSAAWTVAAVNALQIGPVVNS